MAITTDRAYEPVIMNDKGNEGDANIHVYFQNATVAKFTARKHLDDLPWYIVYHRVDPITYMVFFINQHVDYTFR